MFFFSNVLLVSIILSLFNFPFGEVISHIHRLTHAAKVMVLTVGTPLVAQRQINGRFSLFRKSKAHIYAHGNGMITDANLGIQSQEKYTADRNKS